MHWEDICHTSCVCKLSVLGLTLPLLVLLFHSGPASSQLSSWPYLSSPCFAFPFCASDFGSRFGVVFYLCVNTSFEEFHVVPKLDDILLCCLAQTKFDITRS